MKIIAMYLPQYHRIPENDEWWGEGFTDWEAVKRAISLFDGHEQPHTPLNENYYDLMNEDVLRWQASLMNNYGIDGICIYHYWFKNGRQVLEKPVENLLRLKDINMPFCFCWANETWARSWSNLSGSKNTWADTFDRSHANDKDNGVLLYQDYGDEKIWKKHIDYLLEFFLDDRYIKIDGKPVIVIYRVSEINCLNEMIIFWRKAVKDQGLPGIYVIGGNCERDMSGVLDGQLYHEPQLAIRKIKRYRNRNRIDYDSVWKEILETERQYNMQPYFEGFVHYDDSPRRGKEGVIIENASPVSFEKYMANLIQKNSCYGTDITFINAWNEWGEGMYLEPDSKDRYSYLRAVMNAKNSFIRDFPVNLFAKKNNSPKDGDMYLNRVNGNLSAISKWLRIYEKNAKLSDYIKREYPQGIAIYGYGVLGKHLYDECKNNNIEVKFVIEKNSEKVHITEKVYSMNDIFPQNEVIIVTAIYDYDSIYSELKEKGDFMIISLLNIIEKCLFEIEAI